MRSSHSQHVQRRRLCREDRSTPYSPDLDGRHRTRDVQILPILAPGLHDGDAVATGDVLGGVLPRGDENRRDDVGGVRVKSPYNKTSTQELRPSESRFTYAARDRGADHVFRNVEIHKSLRRRFQNGRDYVT